MEFEYQQLKIEILKEDLINYFETAINPVDADLIGINIKDLSNDKIIEIAKNNGFNLNNYTTEKEFDSI